MIRIHGSKKFMIFRPYNTATNKRVDVQVYYGYRQLLEKYCFWANVPTSKGDRQICNTDIEKLSTEMQQVIDLDIDLNWKSMIYIGLTAKTDLEGSGQEGSKHIFMSKWESELKIKAHIVEIAEVGGKKYTKSELPREGWPPVGENPRGLHYSDYDLGAMIEDTTENRLAINFLLQGMERLGTKIKDLIKPESVQATLDTIRANPQLTLEQK